jgi:hypothetical protein
MSVRTRKPLPPPATFLSAIDRSAKDAVNNARTLSVPVMRAALPVRTGRARRGTTGRVARTGVGYKLEVAATSRVRYPNGVSAKQVIRWLHTGTGVFGPRHRPIRPRKAEAFHLPGGWVAGTIPGFKGHDYWGGAAPSATGIVVRAFEIGAHRAAEAAREVMR